jgi:hypothetical protein
MDVHLLNLKPHGRDPRNRKSLMPEGRLTVRSWQSSFPASDPVYISTNAFPDFDAAIEITLNLKASHTQPPRRFAVSLITLKTRIHLMVMLSLCAAQPIYPLVIGETTQYLAGTYTVTPEEVTSKVTTMVSPYRRRSRTSLKQAARRTYQELAVFSCTRAMHRAYTIMQQIYRLYVTLSMRPRPKQIEPESLPDPSLENRDVSPPGTIACIIF